MGAQIGRSAHRFGETGQGLAHLGRALLCWPRQGSAGRDRAMQVRAWHDLGVQIERSAHRFGRTGFDLSGHGPARHC